MTLKQKAKHIRDKVAATLLPEYFPAATNFPSSIPFASPTARAWQGYKKSSTQFGDKKNAPGTDYPSKINETHQKPLLIEESDNIPCDDTATA